MDFLFNAKTLFKVFSHMKIKFIHYHFENFFHFDKVQNDENIHTEKNPYAQSHVATE
jgi:hypothetical protein